jgi:hypothetical protein
MYGLQIGRRRKQEGEKKGLDMACAMVEDSHFDENVKYKLYEGDDEGECHEESRQIPNNPLIVSCVLSFYYITGMSVPAEIRIR